MEVRGRRLLTLLVPALGMAACQDPPASRSVPALEEAALIGSRPDPGPTTGSPPPSFAPGELGPTFAPVTWPDRTQRAPGDVPVLWPDHLPADAATWSRGAGWFTASLPRDSHFVIVHGTRLRFGGTGSEPDRPAAIGRMDGIVEADLVRFGVAYTVTVECEHPNTDTRCTRDEYVKSLVDALVPRKVAP